MDLLGGAGSRDLGSDGLGHTLTVPPQHHPPGSLSSAPVCESSGLTHPLSASAAWFFLFLGGRKQWGSYDGACLQSQHSRLKQESAEFEVSLGQHVRPCLKTQQNRQ